MVTIAMMAAAYGAPPAAIARWFAFGDAGAPALEPRTSGQVRIPLVRGGAPSEEAAASAQSDGSTQFSSGAEEWWGAAAQLDRTPSGSSGTFSPWAPGLVLHQ
jgi:hypothetical protein